MASKLSQRLAAIVDALPLKEGVRVLEIGYGPGAAARAVACCTRTGDMLGIDRSERAIKLAVQGSEDEIAAGRVSFRHAAVEDFELNPAEEKYDLAFAVRVSALDGRHPELQARAIMQIKKALKPGGRLFIDTGDPLREVSL
ncbi:Methyltransferase domain-containing protein [Dyadobacter soli]|uniref:Methyltransferase domain-containing protein n=1 Tax=Dyadobacter soli TaxID=659014 RepID=A0A1G7MBE4_9BACT|nr:methyltransferase domain-containing protein [Dyadobacter soli]SDF59097.1 Methyltransferase domain-containing protein [Dyadobacter soli]